MTSKYWLVILIVITLDHTVDSIQITFRLRMKHVCARARKDRDPADCGVQISLTEIVLKAFYSLHQDLRRKEKRRGREREGKLKSQRRLMFLRLGFSIGGMRFCRSQEAELESERALPTKQSEREKEERKRRGRDGWAACSP